MNLPVIGTYARAYSAHTEPEAQRLIMHGLWRLLFAGVVLSVAGACVWGAYTLSTVFTLLEAQTDSSRTPAMVLDKTALTNLMNTITARAQRFENAKSAPANLADPAR